MNFNIVPIEEKHIEGFWDVLDSVSKERQYLTFLEGPPIDTTRSFVLHCIAANWVHFVAVAEGKIVGWCDISPFNNRPVIAHVGKLGMGVLASHRGYGIGSALMKAALNKAKENGLIRIELQVREKNKPAIALYKKFGFVEEGRHINAACIDGKYEHHISMAKLYSK